MNGFRAMLLSSAVLPTLVVPQPSSQPVFIGEGQPMHGTSSLPVLQIQNPLHQVRDELLQQDEGNQAGKKESGDEDELEDPRFDKKRSVRIASTVTKEEPVVTEDVIYFYYQVNQGDSLYRLAKRYSITLNDLLQANDLPASVGLSVGEWLYIPRRVQVYEVEGTETLAQILEEKGFDIEDVLQLNPELISLQLQLQPGQKLYLPAPPPVKHWQTKRSYQVLPNSITIHRNGERQVVSMDELKKLAPSLQWPVTGQITSFYGMRNGRMHYGIDLWNESKAQTAIKAAAGGTVISAGWHAGYGNTVILQHDENWVTYYAHLSAIQVQQGAWVDVGEELGKMGKTGDSTGVHLHFEIRYQHQPLNPILFLPSPNVDLASQE